MTMRTEEDLVNPKMSFPALFGRKAGGQWLASPDGELQLQ